MKRNPGWSLIITIMAILALGAGNSAFGEGIADVLANQLSSMYSSGEASVDLSKPSKPAFETLRGNGTCTGYILGHGSVIPKSESVTVAGSKMTRDRDYYIDYAGGSIIFVEPVRQTDAVSVTYRYAENARTERTLVGLPGLSLANTKSFSLNLTYAYRAANRDSGQAMPDFATYGINSINKLGGKSSLKTMFFLSTPQHSAKVVNNLAPSTNTQPAQKAKSDQMIIEEGDISLGSLKVKLNYQDVGSDFAGFSSLQDTSPDLAAILPQLNREKGLKRMGFTADFGIGHGMSLSASTNRIKDKTDDIISQSFGFTSGRMKASFNTSEVGQNFSRFGDLKEGNRDQLAKEKGMKRSAFGLEFLFPGASSDSAWNRLGFTTISDPSGEINTRSAAVKFGNLGFDFTSRTVDSSFGRLGNLTRDDLTLMALEIRQQFDPNATAGQVTDDDRKQILSESGIDRNNMGISYTGKSLKGDIRMLSIKDDKGQIERQSASISGKNFSLSLMSQSIDDTFERLGHLAPVEKGQFGNEKGMNRLNMLGSLRSGMGDLSLAFSKMEDNKGAAVLKQSFGFAGDKIRLRIALLNVDPEFDRAGDLADPEKGLIGQERGFNRMDVASNIKLTKHIDLDSFYYNSKSSTDNANRRQLRNQLNYNTSFGARVSLFRDEFTALSSDGKETGYLHQYIKLDHNFKALGGLAFNGLQDTTTTINQDGISTTTVINQMHIETDRNKRAWIASDRKTVDFGNGKVENSQSYNASTKLTSKINLNGMMSMINRGEDGSEEVRQYGVQWAISKRMNFSADVMDRDGLRKDVTAKRIYRLSGIVADDLWRFRNIKLTADRTIEDKQESLSKETNNVRIETNIARGSFIAEFASVLEGSGNHPFSKGFSFVSDRSDRNRLKFDAAYKIRDLGPGDPLAIRCYNIDWKVTKRTALAYNYFSYKEKQDGNLEPVGGTNVKLATALRGFNVTANYKRELNFVTNLDRDIYGLGISGRLPWGALLELGYSLDDMDNNSNRTKGHTYTAKYDHQLGSDHFLTISGELKTWDDPAPGTKKELFARLDFKAMFH